MIVKNNKSHIFLFVSLLILFLRSGKASQFADLCRDAGVSEPRNEQYLFVNGGQVNLPQATKVEEYVFFQGECVIDGANNQLILTPGAKFFVLENSTLTLKNIKLCGLFNIEVPLIPGFFSGNIDCINNESSKILCQNVVWSLIGDFTFRKGRIAVGLHSSFTIENGFDRSLCPVVKFYYKEKDWLVYCSDKSKFELDGVEVECVLDDS